MQLKSSEDQQINHERFLFDNQKLKSSFQRVICTNCNNTILKGPRYICLICKNYDLCPQCEKQLDHSHPLLKITQKQTKQYIPLNRIITKNSFKDGIAQFKQINRRELPVPTIRALKYNVMFMKDRFLEQSKMEINVFGDYEFNLKFLLLNNGEESWPPQQTFIRCINGVFANIEQMVPQESNLRVPINIQIQLQAPHNPKRYDTFWRLYLLDLNFKKYYFGPMFHLLLYLKFILDRIKIGIIVHLCNEKVQKRAKMLWNVFSDEDKQKILFFCQKNENINDIKELVELYQQWQVDKKQ